jgi:DNA-binding winged helix-turn-helix (wHTH) protein
MRRTRSAEPPAIRIEAENEWAWCGGRRLELAPRAFAVLRHLVEHRGRLITKDELLTTVWRDAIVSDAALASGIRDLRRALGESSSAPLYIQTVHRRGFRFIGPVVPAVVSTAPAMIPVRDAASPSSTTSPPFPHPVPALVGREAELSRLHAGLTRALSGQRQVVFVTGEAGIGKTALVEMFLAEVGAAHALRIGHGQCVEQYGAGEAYLPVLEALGRLGRAPSGERLVQVLRQHAPTWLEQLPGLLSDREVSAVRRRGQGATRGRMLRELVEALESLTGMPRSCCCWRISTGVTRRPSTFWACSPDGAKRRGSWSSAPTGPPTWPRSPIRCDGSRTSCNCTGTATRSPWAS